MKNIRVKDIMIPVDDYLKVKEDESLYNVFQAWENERRAAPNRAHRDVLVVDDDGGFLGKLTMADIFRGLEPNYAKLFFDRKNTVLTRDFYRDAVKDFNLWQDPIKNLCERGSRLKVSEIMHVPEKDEFLNEEDSLEKALHEYVMGYHQPLLVRNSDGITGVLRFEDIYNVVRDSMLACPVPA